MTAINVGREAYFCRGLARPEGASMGAEESGELCEKILKKSSGWQVKSEMRKEAWMSPLKRRKKKQLLIIRGKRKERKGVPLLYISNRGLSQR